MDPITRAARQFLAEVDTCWKARPERVLPLVAAPSERGEVVKALRLHERRPENRRPLFLFEAPFTGAAPYFTDLAEAFRQDYELLRMDLLDQGVELTPFSLEGTTIPSSALERAAITMANVAELLGERFEGAIFALVPEQVLDPNGWRQSVRVLAGARWSKRVRVAVFAPQGGVLRGVLGDEGAHFHLAPDELWEYLKQLGAGDPGPEPAATPAARQERRLALEAELGRRLPSTTGGTKLRALLLQAAEASGAGHPSEAAALYHQARAICQAEGLVLEEAMVLLALGGASLAGGYADLAAQAYQQAAELAAGAKQWPMACQAWLGMGGAYLARLEYAPAAVAYREAADTARRGEILPLQIEALRMAGTCLVLLRREDEAMFAWRAAVDIGAEGGAVAREGSTFVEVGRALAELLERRGLVQPAAHVRALVERPAAR